MQIVNIGAVVLPLVGLVLAMVLLWGWGFSWVHLGVMIVMYLVTGFGITVGYHRLFTHRSFETSLPMRIVLAIVGSMAVEGPVLKWVAHHRCHLQHSDRPDDPHSPHLHGEGISGFFKGLFHAHLGWIFMPDTMNLRRYVADLMSERSMRVISALFPVWVLIGLLIPTALGGLLTMSWSGALLGLLWGGLMRIFVVHHITWSINSVCHIWGAQPYRSHDESRNNVLFGILGLGEGWHNNHHAFPTSARHGLAWWQIDVSYWLIRAMEKLGLVWKVKVPSEASMAAKRR
jgi:stearoyl-CoA desaturase (Delta-9 desaturase)